MINSYSITVGKSFRNSTFSCVFGNRPETDAARPSVPIEKSQNNNLSSDSEHLVPLLGPLLLVLLPLLMLLVLLLGRQEWPETQNHE
jgi:hypothetical protein